MNTQLHTFAFTQIKPAYPLNPTPNSDSMYVSFDYQCHSVMHGYVVMQLLVFACEPVQTKMMCAFFFSSLHLHLCIS